MPILAFVPPVASSGNAPCGGCVRAHFMLSPTTSPAVGAVRVAGSRSDRGQMPLDHLEVGAGSMPEEATPHTAWVVRHRLKIRL